MMYAIKENYSRRDSVDSEEGACGGPKASSGEDNGYSGDVSDACVESPEKNRNISFLTLPMRQLSLRGSDTSVESEAAHLRKITRRPKCVSQRSRILADIRSRQASRSSLPGPSTSKAFTPYPGQMDHARDPISSSDTEYEDGPSRGVKRLRNDEPSTSRRLFPPRRPKSTPSKPHITRDSGDEFF